MASKTTQEILHDSVDASERTRAEARDVARKLWAERFQAILHSTETDDPALSGDLTAALATFVQELAVELDPITSAAVRDGASIGRQLKAKRQ